jgi:membrane protein DedA with SNARE-associated domain
VKRDTGGLDPHISPAAGESDPVARRRARNRRHVMWLVLPIVPMWLGVQLSSALFPTLSTENPTLLILLGASNRNLIVAAASAQDWLAIGVAAPAILYAVIGTLRLLAPDPFFFAIGESYGDGAIAWMERRTPTFGQMLRELERLFAKAGWVLVLILPNTYVCLLAGAARMNKSWFWALNIVGTIGRVTIMWFIGQAFQDLIDTILSFIAEYRTFFLVLSIGFVGFTLLREWRSGTTEVQQLLELEHELEEDLDRQLTDELTDELTEPTTADD